MGRSFVVVRAVTGQPSLVRIHRLEDGFLLATGRLVVFEIPTSPRGGFSLLRDVTPRIEEGEYELRFADDGRRWPVVLLRSSSDPGGPDMRVSGASMVPPRSP